MDFGKCLQILQDHAVNKAAERSTVFQNIQIETHHLINEPSNTSAGQDEGNAGDSAAAHTTDAESDAEVAALREKSTAELISNFKSLQVNRVKVNILFYSILIFICLHL